eukprot:361362-Pyramimonas_sp.AAC.2
MLGATRAVCWENLRGASGGRFQFGTSCGMWWERTYGKTLILVQRWSGTYGITTGPCSLLLRGRRLCGGNTRLTRC